ncbi:MAG: alpha/beta hydrolase, partial [Polyangiaceae bacterium]|nr:alpha/beta hydrolase [Polyangiaceae bacterium]
MNKDTPRDAVEGLLANVDRLDVRMMTSLAQSYILHSSRETLPRVEVPVLFLVGARDSLASPSHAHEVVGTMRDAREYVVFGCTHLALLEAPGEVHRVVDKFLESIH